eukprot:CAMPEP_0194363716 /NCGR_PEP_ID=MMETSP0174-20130528/11560_1 /TAXON_ID=216777 /ORGANISM="Proboscia alata, Strain PI-D3" /LENGTH=153 /DNA_ID=CAMNT_0039137319 /DNA_START=334 /DNA_END=795 /DNA_ORIENTATION=+
MNFFLRFNLNNTKPQCLKKATDEERYRKVLAAERDAALSKSDKRKIKKSDNRNGIADTGLCGTVVALMSEKGAESDDDSSHSENENDSRGRRKKKKRKKCDRSESADRKKSRKKKRSKKRRKEKKKSSRHRRDDESSQYSSSSDGGDNFLKKR